MIHNLLTSHALSNCSHIIYIGINSPKFIIKPESTSTSVGNYRIRLNCLATGEPRPVISWSQNGITLTITSRHTVESDGSLVISPVEASDYGSYRCEAANPYGRISATAEVRINGKNTTISYVRIIFDHILLCLHFFYLMSSMN